MLCALDHFHTAAGAKILNRVANKIVPGLRPSVVLHLQVVPRFGGVRSSATPPTGEVDHCCRWFPIAAWVLKLGPFKGFARRRTSLTFRRTSRRLHRGRGLGARPQMTSSDQDLVEGDSGPRNLSSAVSSCWRLKGFER